MLFYKSVHFLYSPKLHSNPCTEICLEKKSPGHSSCAKPQLESPACIRLDRITRVGREEKERTYPRGVCVKPEGENQGYQHRQY